MGYKIIGGGSSGGGGGGPAFTDTFSLGIKFADTNASPTDTGAFALSAAYADTNAAQSDTAQLKFPAPDFADTSVAPTDANSVTMRVWLSATTMNSTNGVTSPANADGANNGAVATYTSAAAGDANPRTTSTLGGNVPSVTVTSVSLRGWFKSVNTLATSTTKLVLHSSSALFADQIIFSNTTLNSTVDHLSGDFTYDLIANGINTLAKIQSVQLLASTQDAAAGVTPAVLTLDAATLEIVGAF